MPIDFHSESAYHYQHHQQQRLQQQQQHSALCASSSSTMVKYRHHYPRGEPQQLQDPPPYGHCTSCNHSGCSMSNTTGQPLLAPLAPPLPLRISSHSSSITGSSTSSNSSHKSDSDGLEGYHWSGGGGYCTCTPQYQCMACAPRALHGTNMPPSQPHHHQQERIIIHSDDLPPTVLPGPDKAPVDYSHVFLHNEEDATAAITPLLVGCL